MNKETAQAITDQLASDVLAVLRMGDVPPVRALYCPGYLRELRSEVVKGADDSYYVAITIPKRGYGTYKRRSPKNRAIPPEVDVKQLEAVFTLFLPAGIQVVAVRNALENVKIFLEKKEIQN